MPKGKPREDKPSDLRAETEGDAEKLIASAKVVHALCMMRKHKWPEWDLRPGQTKLPAGYVVGPIRYDGLLDIRENCLRGCGEFVTYLVRPEELFGIGIRKNYHRPKDRPIVAHGISRQVWAAPLQSVLQDRVLAAAKRATEAAERATAKIEEEG